MAATAAKLLAAGQVVIIPTDTLYALAADICNPQAVALVYKIKQRLEDKFFPMLVNGVDMACEYVKPSELSQRLMQKFWPGQLTIVMPVVDDCRIASNAYNKKDIAVRVPDSPFAREVIRLLGRPIVGTSANLSGGSNLKTQEELSAVFAELVGGIFTEDNLNCPGQSTIISAYDNSIQLIREGMVKVDDLEKL